MIENMHNPNELQVGTTVLQRIPVKNSVKVVNWMIVGLVHVLLTDALEKVYMS